MYTCGIRRMDTVLFDAVHKKEVVVEIAVA